LLQRFRALQPDCLATNNRKLFIYRLGAFANFANTMPNLRPTLMGLDLDRF